VTGKLLLSQKLTNLTENTIDTTSLSKGIYVVAVETENGSSYTNKLIVE
jgi:hypothetical protein